MESNKVLFQCSNSKWKFLVGNSDDFRRRLHRVFSQIQQANQSTSGSKWRSGDNVLWIKVFWKQKRVMDVTFDTFWSGVCSYLWGEAGGMCNITSLNLCRDNMGREELIPRFLSIHLYQWDPENCGCMICMAQTSWLLVYQMSILPVIRRTDSEQKTFSKRRLSCVCWRHGFFEREKNNTKIFKERSFLVPRHPNTVWEGLF